jgi:hypothetical protein
LPALFDKAACSLVTVAERQARNRSLLSAAENLGRMARLARFFAALRMTKEAFRNKNSFA